MPSAPRKKKEFLVNLLLLKSSFIYSLNEQLSAMAVKLMCQSSSKWNLPSEPDSISWGWTPPRFTPWHVSHLPGKTLCFPPLPLSLGEWLPCAVPVVAGEGSVTPGWHSQPGASAMPAAERDAAHFREREATWMELTQGLIQAMSWAMLSCAII